jgi:hypothetical protein
MTNPYYDHTTYPAPNAPGSSAALRAEFDKVEQGFEKLPTLSGQGGKAVAVKADGSGLEAVNALAVNITGTVTGNVTGNLTGSVTGNVTGNVSGTASNVTGTVAIANGGTGATTRQEAMDALAGAVTAGQYLRGNGTDVVMSALQIADVTGTLPIANGGTGATTAPAARANLLPSFAGNAGLVARVNSTATDLEYFSVPGTGDVTLTGTQTLTNKTFGNYTETVYNLVGTEIASTNGPIQYKTLSGNTTFTETLADGQSVVLMLNPSTFAVTWPTITWIGNVASTAPTLVASVYNCITLFQITGTVYGKFEGRV